MYPAGVEDCHGLPHCPEGSRGSSSQGYGDPQGCNNYIISCPLMYAAGDKFTGGHADKLVGIPIVVGAGGLAG